MTKNDISMTRNRNGSITLYIVVDGQYKECTYYDYSEREARNKFYKEYVKSNCNMCDEGVTEYPIDNGVCTWCERKVDNE